MWAFQIIGKQSEILPRAAGLQSGDKIFVQKRLKPYIFSAKILFIII
jgi:hypothetical protein